MCTVVVNIRPDHILLAANRDERVDRPWDPPAEHWSGIFGGRDRTAGGTWMAMNRAGLVATVLNRPGTLGPVAGKRSRGDLPLLALRHQTLQDAADALSGLDARQWRPFNMVLAGRTGAVFVRGLGSGRPEAYPLPACVSMVTAYDPNDIESPRTARHLPRFQAAEPTQDAWLPILADSAGSVAEQINVIPHGGFGTVCASFVAWTPTSGPDWLFAAGPPDRTAFLPVLWNPA